VAESTIIKTRIDGTIQLAALGGGAYNTTTGALIGAALSYTVAFEAGDLSITLPSRAVNNFRDRGRITSPPSLRYGEDAEGSFAFTAHLRDLSDAAAATLMDIAATISGNPTGYVGSNWESTLASSAGAGDAEVFAIGAKLTITNAGDGTDTHAMAFNYLTGTISLSEGDPNTISINWVINDPVDDYYIA
jgi:hypothetical protein